MQFNDGGADWCIHCGGFDVYLEDECATEQTGRFDARRPEKFLRVYVGLFGDEDLTDAGRAALEAA